MLLSSSHSSWMLAPQNIFLAIVLISAVSFLAVREIFKPLHHRKAPKGKRWNLPPGPPGTPIVGNLLQLQNSRGDEVRLLNYLANLAQYGEMTTLHMGSKTWVLLNSNRVVSEIIAKRGSITHERPYMPVVSGLVSRGKRFVLQPSSWWTEGRRVTHHLLSGSALKTYGEFQELESVQLLASYLYKPGQWYAHHFQYSVSVVHRVILGERIAKSSRELGDLQRITTEFIRCLNANIVDFFPMLAKLPNMLQPWRKRYLKMGQEHYDCFRAWWVPVTQKIAQGTAPPSFVRDALLNPETRYSGTDEDAMYLATSVISAGSDNPRMVMNCFVMALLCFPDVGRKIREEVDRVCGCKAERLPSVKDMPAMPYLCATVKEILRWRPTVPIVPQHQLIQDLEFEGYHFPAGTEFLINGIAVGKDYPEPEIFRPERWLDGNEQAVAHGLWHFGGGRRICVGHRVAQIELFLAFARLVYCFDYASRGPLDDSRMQPFTADEPFPVDVTVRGKEFECLIANEATRCGFVESAKAGF